MFDFLEPGGANADSAIHLAAMVIVPAVFGILMFFIWRRKLSAIRQKPITGSIVTSDQEEALAWQETKNIMRPASGAMKLMLHTFEMALLCVCSIGIAALFGFEIFVGCFGRDTSFTTNEWLWFSGLFLFFSVMAWYMGKAAASNFRQLRAQHQNEKRLSKDG